MKEYIVVHSARENEDREMITDWCRENFKSNNWHLFSDYREEGTFSLKFNSSIDADFYILKWGGFVVETDKFTDLFGII